MNQFTFESKQKTILLAFMGLGALCLALSFFMDAQPAHARFWSNFLHNTVFFTGIAFVSLFVMTAFITAYAGWYVLFKRVWEAYAAFLIPGLVMLGVVILGLWTGWHHLYHWADPAEVAKDPILEHKSSFLNKNWYTLGTLIIVGAWIFFQRRLRSLSLAEDKLDSTGDFSLHRKMKVVAAAFLPIGAFTSAAMIWQWVMSVDAHWYSTLFAWYSTASWFVACLALTILTVVWLKSKGYLEQVSSEHLHDLGKYLFAFSIFWTYLWFSQFMLIWYANVGEETVYFNTRRHEFPVMFYGNLFINFLVPFFILMRNDTKRKYGTMVFTSLIVFFGHWWDYFLMIKPGVLETASHLGHGEDHGEAAGHGAEHLSEAASHGADHAGDVAHAAATHASDFVSGFTLPGLLEIGTMLGFLAFFLFFTLRQLEKASLLPKNDPYLEESKHHHVM
ncbi:MAG: hypothetical protein GYB31_07300 [Bacteroidetes bacterium]|nr:hypothetical protein [Bacteroidota bacterium]